MIAITIGTTIVEKPKTIDNIPKTKSGLTLFIIDILLMLKMYTLDKFPKLQLDTIVSTLKIVKKCIHFFMPISEETFFN